MEQEQQVQPMTLEEIAREDAAAEQFYQEFQSFESDDTELNRFREMLKLHRRSPAFGFRAHSPKGRCLETIRGRPSGREFDGRD